VELQQRIADRRGEFLIFAVTPPRLTTGPEQTRLIAEVTLARLQSVGIDGLVLYDIDANSTLTLLGAENVRDQTPPPSTAPHHPQHRSVPRVTATHQRQKLAAPYPTPRLQPKRAGPGAAPPARRLASTGVIVLDPGRDLRVVVLQPPPGSSPTSRSSTRPRHHRT
jgi:hypothetical protein